QKNHSLKPIHDKKPSSANSDINSSQSRICVFCNGPHKSFLCDSTLSPMEREKIRRNEGLCHICFLKHDVSKCYSPYRCKNCNGLHSKLLCMAKPNSQVVKLGTPVVKYVE